MRLIFRMRFSLTRLAAASTVAAALLLAACAGRGVVPSANSFGPGMADGNKLPAPKKTSSPCTKTQQPWIFAGACGTVTLTDVGGQTASMPKYAGLAVKAKFSASNAKPNTVLVVRDATGKHDVTGNLKGKTMPAFAPNSKFKPLIYMKVHNQGAAFAFSGIPQITITTASAFPAKTFCVLTQKQATNDNWVTEPVLPGKVSGKIVTFPAKTQQEPIAKSGTVYLAVACDYGG